jgi:hypothetical protein
MIRSRIIKFSWIIFVLLRYNSGTAQDLDPRAYVKLPVHGNILIAGFAYSQGGVLTDPTLPLTDLEAKVEMFSLGAARTFSFFGQTAQFFAVLPMGWVQATALVNGQEESTDRTGIADMRVRLSVLLLGGKAVTVSDFSKEKKKTILGTSLTIIAPTGQYFNDKLINLGTSRWAFKPEIALSQVIGKRWMIDVYSGIWIFTTNNSFYPGSSVRKQDPLLAFQTHFSYNITPRAWVAFNATFYTGGQSSINDVLKDDRQENSRIGVTLSLPVGKRNSLKIAVSKGAIIRVGADFTTVSVGWSTAWFKKATTTDTNN